MPNGGEWPSHDPPRLPTRCVRIGASSETTSPIPPNRSPRNGVTPDCRSKLRQQGHALEVCAGSLRSSRPEGGRTVSRVAQERPWPSQRTPEGEASARRVVAETPSLVAWAEARTKRPEAVSKPANRTLRAPTARADVRPRSAGVPEGTAPHEVQQTAAAPKGGSRAAATRRWTRRSIERSERIPEGLRTTRKTRPLTGTRPDRESPCNVAAGSGRAVRRRPVRGVRSPRLAASPGRPPSEEGMATRRRGTGRRTCGHCPETEHRPP